MARLEWLLWAPWGIWRRLTGARYWERRAIEEGRRADALDGLVTTMEQTPDREGVGDE